MARKTTIFEAIATGDPVRVKRKLSREPGALAERDGQGRSPLLVAIYAGDDDVVAAVLAAGPELDVHEAAALGRTDELKRLLGRSRTRANAFSTDGFAPLHLAAYFGHVDAAALLLDRGAEVDARSTNRALRHVTPLHSAAAGGRADVAALLLDRGADPNAAQPGGWTALHQAAASGNVELCLVLLKHKARKTAQADDRFTPLELAIDRRQGAVVELLRPDR